MNKTPKDKNKEYLDALCTSLRAKGIDPANLGAIKKSSSYQRAYKDESGELKVRDLWSFQYESVLVNQTPNWPMVKPGPCYTLPRQKVASIQRKQKVCVIVPDVQIGYYRDKSGELVPTHDEKAINIALNVIADLQPDIIVCVGDNLDFPEFSKYRITPAFQQTTQASIDRAALLAAQLRNAGPKSHIVWLAGNHEERLPNYIIDNAMAAFALKKGNHPESWPVMSVPSLCRFDNYKVEYIPGYPAGEFWINDNLKVIHGTKAKTNANTAHAYLRDEKVSVIYGHIHRIETAYKTRRGPKGSGTIMAASPGCLARLDGAVPSTKGSKDLDGRPVIVAEDWQQGLAVITYQTTGEQKFSYEVMPIHNGWAMFRGTEYLA